jgi:lysophosphatidate acyltransferase
MRNVIFVSKTGAAGLMVLLASAFGCFSSLFLYAVGKRNYISNYVAKFFYGGLSPLLGITIDLLGEEHLLPCQDDDFDGRKPCIIVANHQSTLDLLPMGRMFPKYCVVLAKSSLRYAFFLLQLDGFYLQCTQLCPLPWHVQ